MSYNHAGAEPKTSDIATRPKWRTPVLTEDAIADATMSVTLVAGSDGYDATPPYSTSGNS